VVEINPQPTALSGLVDHVCRGSAATVLPEVLG
jgi:NAD-dependent SIR2 family protein deacetylase